MDKKIKHIARTGYASKGVVYALIGILALGAAIGLGRSSEGKLGLLKFLEEQPFGKVLLGLIGLGFFCYAFWRFFQSIKDPEDIGNDAKGIGIRIGFFFSGSVYLGLGVYSLYEIIRESSGSENTKSEMFPMEFLPYVFYAVGGGLAIKSIFQFIKAFKGDFLSQFHLNTMTNFNARTAIKWLGYAGMVSRGIVEGIVAYFFLRAAGNAGTKDIKGTADAFSFIGQGAEGPWLVGSVAFGLICFGIYMFIKAKYRTFND